MGIPEEAGEIIEIVDDPAPAAPIVPRSEPDDFPEEAIQQIRSLKAPLERKDKQIEQVMEAYRSKKTETEKQRGRIEKTEKRRFEQSKGDFIARFVEVLDNLDRAIDSIEGNFDPDAVLQGIMLTRSRLVQLLKTEGLEKIFVRGQTFDPMHSEAARNGGSFRRNARRRGDQRAAAGLYAERLAPPACARSRGPIRKLPRTRCTRRTH